MRSPDDPAADAPAVPASDAPAPAANLVLPAILVTAFCFLPFGLVAIVAALRARRLAARGDAAGAQTASGQARTAIWLAVALGAILGLVGGVLHAIGFWSGR